MIGQLKTMLPTLKFKFSTEMAVATIAVPAPFGRKILKSIMKWQRLHCNVVKYNKVKVISGDNPLTVSKISERAGIENAHRYISLDGLSDKEKECILKFKEFFAD